MSKNNTVTKIKQAPGKPHPKDLPEAFLAFQRMGIKALKKKNNPHFKNDYADLEEVLSACSQANQFNIIHYFKSSITEGGTLIIEAVMEFVPTKERWTISIPCYCADRNNPQKLGSAITYAKRYSLSTLFALSSADDDGNQGSQRPDKPSTEKIKVENVMDTTTNEEDPF